MTVMSRSLQRASHDMQDCGYAVMQSNGNVVIAAALQTSTPELEHVYTTTVMKDVLRLFFFDKMVYGS